MASNVGLLATAAYVISAAALVAFLAMLVIPIYLVRLFGVSRAGARYAERLVSHDLTFKLLADFRTWFYTRLEPLAPARLLRYRSGDLLSRIVEDVEELQNVYLRIVAPVAVALRRSRFSTFASALLLRPPAGLRRPRVSAGRGHRGAASGRTLWRGGSGGGSWS